MPSTLCFEARNAAVKTISAILANSLGWIENRCGTLIQICAPLTAEYLAGSTPGSARKTRPTSSSV